MKKEKLVNAYIREFGKRNFFGSSKKIDMLMFVTTH